PLNRSILQSCNHSLHASSSLCADTKSSETIAYLLGVRTLQSPENIHQFLAARIPQVERFCVCKHTLIPCEHRADQNEPQLSLLLSRTARIVHHAHSLIDPHSPL